MSVRSRMGPSRAGMTPLRVAMVERTSSMATAAVATTSGIASTVNRRRTPKTPAPRTSKPRARVLIRNPSVPLAVLRRGALRVDALSDY